MLKKTFAALALIFSVFIFSAFAQEKTAWTRIESDNKEVSVSFPSDFLVDVEPDDYGREIFVIGFYKDAEMELSIIKPDNTKLYFQGIEPAERSGTTGNIFEMNGLKGKNFVTKKDKSYANAFYLASTDYIYVISVFAKIDEQEKILQSQAVSRFINSIRIKGQRLIVPPKQTEDNDSIVSSSSLKTSLKVLEVLNAERGKTSISDKIKYAAKNETKVEDENNYSRPLIFLRKPPPRYTDRARQENVSGTVKLKVKFQADGSIGDVIVLSKLHRDLDRSAVEAAEKIKFLPAEVDGKRIDVVKEVAYSFVIY